MREHMLAACSVDMEANRLLADRTLGEKSWVWATLIETALVAHELVLPPLTRQQREQYYRESQLFAALFGIPQECVPPDFCLFFRHGRIRNFEHQ
jgi:mpaB/rubber oxygenase-like protein